MMRIPTPPGCGRNGGRMATGLKRDVVSSLFWRLVEQSGRQIIQVAVQIVMARLLAPDMFGTLAVALVVVNLGNVIVTSGLNTALVQVKDVHEDDWHTVFWLCLGMGCVMFAVAAASAPLIAGFYGRPELTAVIRALALLFVVNAYNSVQVAWLQRSLRFRPFAASTLLSVVVSGVCGVAVALLEGGLWALVCQQITYQCVNCLALSRTVPWRPRPRFDAGRARTLYRFGWKLLASSLLDTLYQNLASLLIGKRFSATDLGLFSQGQKIPSAAGSMLNGALQPVFLSAFSRIQDDPVRLKGAMRRALKAVTFLVFPAMTCLAVIAEPLVRVLMGERWLPCVPYLQGMCFLYALLPVQTTNLGAINALSRSDVFLRLEVVKKAYGVALLAGATFLLRDMRAIIAAYMIDALIASAVNASPNKRLIGYSYGEQVADMLPAALLSIGCGCAVSPIALLPVGDTAAMVLQIVAMAVLYLSLSRLFGLQALRVLVGACGEVLSRRYRTIKKEEQ